MSMVSLARRRPVAQTRPDWMPHPVVMELIVALWVVAAALQFFGPHF